MKKSSLALATTVILVLVVNLVDVRAQGSGTPPALSVSLVLTSTKYLFANPTDAINAEITIRNTGSVPIVTSAGFSQRPFHLSLIFVDPDGKPITASEAGAGVHEGAPPRIIPVGNAYLQVEEVEILPVGFIKVVTIPDLRAFYTLPKAGRYSVKAVVAFRNYSSFFTSDGKNFASIDSFAFAGALESENIRFSLIADADNDGYAFPEPDSRISNQMVIDCDDNDPNVNPGMVEILGDGKDNDCNPATPDVHQTVTVQLQIPVSFKVGAGGTFPVAIFSTATFDATKIDPQSVSVEGASVLVKGKGTPMASFEDVNKDGRLDLVVHVARESMTLSTGDTQVVLTGKTIPAPGKPSVDVRGVATIKVIP